VVCEPREASLSGPRPRKGAFFCPFAAGNPCGQRPASVLVPYRRPYSVLPRKAGGKCGKLRFVQAFSLPNHPPSSLFSLPFAPPFAPPYSLPYSLPAQENGGPPLSLFPGYSDELSPHNPFEIPSSNVPLLRFPYVVFIFFYLL
jgi:hypothetical protein